MKKIMFNDALCLTQAVLNGTKTMTRWILKYGTPLGNLEERGRLLGLAYSINKRFSRDASNLDCGMLRDLTQKYVVLISIVPIMNCYLNLI